MSPPDDDPYRTGSAAPAALVALAAGADAKRRELPREARDYGSRDARVRNALDVRVAVGVLSIVCLSVAAAFLVVGAEAGNAAAAIFGVLLSVGGIAVDAAWYRASKRRVAALLHADAHHAFPIEGYDLWLASERPLFDVTLRADVDQRVVTDATAALDPDIAIEWLEPRVFRVAIPARLLGSEPVTYGGDRAAWLRFAEKILAPLHADPGIVRVDMGGSMRALPPG